VSHRASVITHLRGAGVPLLPASAEDDLFNFLDYEKRFDFAVSVGELPGLGKRWSVTVTVDSEDEESIAGLKRLPNLPTSKREASSYIRWSPFTADSAEDAPRRVSDWIVGTIANAAERLRLSRTPPADVEADEATDSSKHEQLAAVPNEQDNAFNVGLDDDSIKELIHAVSGAADPRLALVEALERRSLLRASLKAEILGAISLERGDVDSVIEAALQGRALTPQQAQILVQAAVTTHEIDSAVLATVLDLAQASWDHAARTRVIANVRAKKSHKMAQHHLGLMAKLVPVEFASELGTTLLELANASDVGLAEKKASHIEVLRSMLGAGLSETVVLAVRALQLGKIRPFDLWSDPALQAAFSGQLPAVDLIYRAALIDSTEPDLRAAGAALLTQESGSLRTKMMSKWLKRWQEAGYPLNEKSQPIMEAVVREVANIHVGHPSSEEAQRDHLVIQRLAAEYPHVTSFGEAAAAIDAARRPGSAAAVKEREDTARFERASTYIKDQIAGKKRRIIVVGGRPTDTTVEAVNEFHTPDDDNWLEWLTAGRDETINRRNIVSKIRGDSCVALVLLTGAIGHARSKLARETGKAVNRLIVEVRSTSRDDVRRALFEVTEKLAKNS
jgi:hypothetical protein